MFLQASRVIIIIALHSVDIIVVILMHDVLTKRILTLLSFMDQRDAVKKKLLFLAGLTGTSWTVKDAKPCES